MNKMILISGYDVLGIGAIISKVLFELNCITCNFKIVTLTGFFSVLIEVKSDISEKNLEKELKTNTDKFNLTIKVYKIEEEKNNISLKNDDWIPYKLNIICNDQTKALYLFMKAIADLNINIANLFCSQIGINDDNSYKISLVLEVPITTSTKLLETNLNNLARELNMLIDIHSVNDLEF